MTSKLNTSAISVEIEGARVAKNVPVVSCVCGRGRWDVSSSARVSGFGSLSLAVIGKYTCGTGHQDALLQNKNGESFPVTRARWRNPSRFFLFAPEWSFYLYRSGAVGVHVYTKALFRCGKILQTFPAVVSSVSSWLVR